MGHFRIVSCIANTFSFLRWLLDIWQIVVGVVVIFWLMMMVGRVLVGFAFAKINKEKANSKFWSISNVNQSIN